MIVTASPLVEKQKVKADTYDKMKCAVTTLLAEAIR